MPHGAKERLRRFAAQALNPPFLAILAGLAVGLSPLGHALFGPAAAAGTAAQQAAGAAAAALPLELRLAQAALRLAIEVVQLLAQATLAVQTIVLASSLLQQTEGEREGAAPSAPRPRHRSWLAAAAAQLLPQDAMEGRALAVIGLTRFLLLPVATLASMRLLGALRLLPGGAAGADPVLLFVLLAQSVMPSAQVGRGAEQIVPYANRLCSAHPLAGVAQCAAGGRNLS